ncbi:MAG TPA: hypothetical protein VIC34_00805 [Croceibacterium sp.]|jgi:hypothetical protein
MASAAAALAARARREIQHRFFAADAVRPDRAIAFAPANGYEERQFARLRDQGVIHEDTSGRCWLDLPAYDIALRARHQRVRLALIALAVLAGAYAAIAGAIAVGLIAR